MVGSYEVIATHTLGGSTASTLIWKTGGSWESGPIRHSRHSTPSRRQRITRKTLKCGPPLMENLHGMVETGAGHDPLFLTWPFNVQLRNPRPSQPNKTLGKAIKRCRAALGMTQAGLAARLGIDRKTVRSWERGDTVPARGEIASLGECLQVDLFSLV